MNGIATLNLLLSDSVLSSDRYFDVQNYGAWLVIAVFFWFLGWFIGLLLWRKAAVEAQKIEQETMVLREEEARLRESIAG